MTLEKKLLYPKYKQKPYRTKATDIVQNGIKYFPIKKQQKRLKTSSFDLSEFLDDNSPISSDSDQSQEGKPHKGKTRWGIRKYLTLISATTAMGMALGFGAFLYSVTHSSQWIEKHRSALISHRKEIVNTLSDGVVNEFEQLDLKERMESLPFYLPGELKPLKDEVVAGISKCLDAAELNLNLVPQNASMVLKNTDERLRNGLKFMPGQYTILLSADGYKPREYSFTVKGRNLIRGTVALEMKQYNHKKLKYGIPESLFQTICRKDGKYCCRREKWHAWSVNLGKIKGYMYRNNCFGGNAVEPPFELYVWNGKGWKRKFAVPGTDFTVLNHYTKGVKDFKVKNRRKWTTYSWNGTHFES